VVAADALERKPAGHVVPRQMRWMRYGLPLHSCFCRAVHRAVRPGRLYSYSGGNEMGVSVGGPEDVAKLSASVVEPTIAALKRPPQATRIQERGE